MNQFTPYRLWIGHAGDGHAFQEIFDKGIKAIVQLALEEAPLGPPRELVYFRFPLLDGTGNDPGVLRLAITNVAALMRRGTPTLVCCGAGMSRSPAIVAAALSTIEPADVEECLKRVIRLHPADVSPGLWKKVCDAILGSSHGSVIMNNGNRSGDPAIDRNDAYYRRTWEEALDKTFSQTVFYPSPALVRKRLVNSHRMWRPYEGGEFDRAEFDLVEDMWDHEHCSICNFRIVAGNTYWFNQGRVRLLCDECRDHFSES